MYNFPCIIKTQDVLCIEDLLIEVKNGNFVEASLPNGVLSMSSNGKYLFFDGGKNDKRAVIPESMSEKKLRNWIEGLLPVETEEEKQDRIATEVAMEKYYEEKWKEDIMEQNYSDDCEEELCGF